HCGRPRAHEAHRAHRQHQPSAADRARRAGRRAQGGAPGQGGGRRLRGGAAARHDAPAAQHAQRGVHAAPGLRDARGRRDRVLGDLRADQCVRRGQAAEPGEPRSSGRYASLIRDSIRLPLAFFASGAAALLFEVLWFRALGRVLGNTVWAAALVLTAFMLGIALGGWLASRWAERIRRPALAFAAAEITVALTGGLLVWGLPAAEPIVGGWLVSLVGHPTALTASRLLLAVAAMLVPTTAMGTTLALGVRALGARDTAKALGVLYAANTFGACVAPLLAEYHLIGALGLSGTAAVASGLDLVAAALASMGAAAPLTSDPAPSPGHQSSPKRLLAVAALSGGIALALEVVWFRLLLLYAPGTDKTF